MYKLEYLPSALRDMTEIARYISAELKSPAAAEKLAEELIEAAERTAAFPYANPVYVPIRQLQRDYRKRAAKNQLIFYYVDDERKTVTLPRRTSSRREPSPPLGNAHRVAHHSSLPVIPVALTVASSPPSLLSTTRSRLRR